MTTDAPIVLEAIALGYALGADRKAAARLLERLPVKGWRKALRPIVAKLGKDAEFIKELQAALQLTGSKNKKSAIAWIVETLEPFNLDRWTGDEAALMHKKLLSAKPEELASFFHRLNGLAKNDTK